MSVSNERTHASALRGAIKNAGVLLPTGRGFQLSTMANGVRRSAVKTPGKPGKARPT